MNGCKIETYSVKPTEPLTKCKEWFYLYSEDNSSEQVVTWRGHFGGSKYFNSFQNQGHTSLLIRIDKNSTANRKKTPKNAFLYIADLSR